MVDRFRKLVEYLEWKVLLLAFLRVGITGSEGESEGHSTHMFQSRAFREFDKLSCFDRSCNVRKSS
jgi:hypothetical protein